MLAIRAARLFDGVTDQLHAAPLVLVDGGRITDVDFTVQGMRAAVRALAAREVDVVKVMVTGGNLTAGSVPWQSQYGPAELRAAVEEAHRAGLAITGHAWGAQGIAEAVAAGFDSIEHGVSLTADGVHQDPAVVDQLAARGVVVSVTSAQSQPLGQPPPGMEPGSELARRFQELARQVPQFVAGVLRLREARVPITVSSDAGIGPHKPHDVLPWGPGLASMIGLHRCRGAAGGHLDRCRRLPGRRP